jgi:predicted kinase
LLLLNGAPGVGKSTLARRYVDDHPLALLLEVDGIRTALGRWDEVEGSRLAARRLAAAMAEAHLRDGHDVVVPQFLGRLPFIDTLDAIAQQTGSSFREVILGADDDAIVERFRARRSDLAAMGHAHPQADVDARDIAREIAAAQRSLDVVRAARPGTILVAATRDADATYRALSAVV